MDGEYELVFQGIDAFGGKSQPLKSELQRLFTDYRERKETARAEIEKNLLAQWANQGISGSAVQPKVDGSLEWENALSTFKPAFEEQLRVLQEELKKQ